MRYPECQKDERSCENCALSLCNKDCRGNPVNQLAYLRTQAGLRQEELAKRAGVTQSNVSRLETGSRDIGNVSLRLAARIAAALGVHAEELLNTPD